jgi:uncharacterized lipoprotein YddW (UPF0748 family)
MTGDHVPEQWRSYWADAYHKGVRDPAQIRALVDASTAMNANAVIVQTVCRYDAFGNRALYPRTDAPIMAEPFDPLDEVIDQARRAGLEVHAWVNINTLWNSPTPPRSPDHVFNRHGFSASGRDRWLNKRADGVELVGNSSYIDPGHPDVQDYIVAGIGSIVREYDVDGINLDFVRYPDHSSTHDHSDWGYNEVAVDRFLKEAGGSDVPPPDDAEWTQWRREQITSLVRRIYREIAEVKPSARLSADVIAWGPGPASAGGWERTWAYTEFLQDWVGWLREGIVDTVLTMNYKAASDETEARSFAEWTEFAADLDTDRTIVNGLGLYLNSVGETLAQIEATFTPTAAGNVAAGWSGFSYANPSATHLEGEWDARNEERRKLTEAIAGHGEAPCASAAVVPPMPWKAG